MQGRETMQTAMKEMTRDRDYYLRSARQCWVLPELREKVADYCVANPSENLAMLHVVWVLGSRKLPCSCVPCALARGEKLSCL